MFGEGLAGEMLAQRKYYENQPVEYPSTWLVIPYFVAYFATLVSNTVLWPLYLLERTCAEAPPQMEVLSFDVLNSSSCMASLVNGGNDTVRDQVYDSTLPVLTAITVLTGTVLPSILFRLTRA